MNRDQRILITGATGLVGSYVARLLHQNGYRNLAGTRRTTSRMELPGRAGTDMEWFTGDITDPEFCARVIEHAEVVIHTAAFISFHKRDYDRIMAINRGATAYLANASIDQGIKQFIYVSSIAALGRSEPDEVLSEETIWRRSNYNSVYAISKFLGEMEAWRAYAEGLPVAVINPSTILGGGYWGAGSLEILEKVWNGLKFYTSGSTGFVDVRDVARAVQLLLEKQIKGRRYIINGANLPYREAFRKIATGLGKRPPAIRIGPWVAEAAWRGSRLLSAITGKKPFIEREVARLTQNRYIYRNGRSTEELGLEYTDIDETIRETTEIYRQSMEKNLDFGVLSFKREKSIVS